MTTTTNPSSQTQPPPTGGTTGPGYGQQLPNMTDAPNNAQYSRYPIEDLTAELMFKSGWVLGRSTRGTILGDDLSRVQHYMMDVAAGIAEVDERLHDVLQEVK